MSIRSLLACLAALGCAAAHAASSGQLVSPQNVSVVGGESRTFSVRFFDALGHPSVGESVQWANDACGRFNNGGFSMTTLTDATGMASVNFTALNPAGITCWLTAGAGVTLQFNVNTYQLRQVYFTTSTSPIVPQPAQPFTLRVNPMQGAYHLYEVDVTARVIAGTASATVSPASANTRQSGTVEFAVVPDGRAGAYDIEIAHHGVTQRITMGLPANGWQDMWWSSTENGWGMSITQHGEMFFSVIYAYDAAGKPTWYVIPAGTWNAAHTVFTGSMYRPTGSPYTAYDTTKFVAGAAIGTAQLTFVGYSDVALDYVIGGVTGHKALTRQSFGTADPAFTASYGDMWWGGPPQDGWGMAMLQQGHAIFGVWFTYDATGAPTWFVMPSGNWSDATTWEGRVYRTTGSPWLGHTYDPAALQATDAGSFRTRFGTGTATFDYTIDGHSGTLSLSRQPF